VSPLEPGQAGPTEPVTGVAYVLGDFVDADAIIPVRYCTRPAPEVLSRRCLAMIDADFPAKARKGLIIVAGKDFGRGSANENPVRALLLCGVKGVIAASFGGLFKRNAINMGLPVVESSELANIAENGDKILIDFSIPRCADISAGVEIELNEMSDLELQIQRSKGLINWLNNGGIDQITTAEAQ
jgi:3-isopropylmalate/(R)-2-methylmalate dehydratase small subunit